MLDIEMTIVTVQGEADQSAAQRVLDEQTLRPFTMQNITPPEGLLANMPKAGCVVMVILRGDRETDFLELEVRDWAQAALLKPGAKIKVTLTVLG